MNFKKNKIIKNKKLIDQVESTYNRINTIKKKLKIILEHILLKDYGLLLSHELKKESQKQSMNRKIFIGRMGLNSD